MAERAEPPTAPSVPTGPPLLTVDDYAELPDDGNRYEIIEGALHVTPAPIPRHQRIAARLLYLLMDQLDRTGAGDVYAAPIDVVFDRHSTVQPDLLFIRKERLGIVGEKNIRGAPDLVVEVLSPATRRRDVITKARLYARFGVPIYWLVDPEADRLERYVLEDETYRRVEIHDSPQVVEPEELPGVRVPLAELFEQA